MAKLELSSNLKSMKFMQRAVAKEEKIKKEVKVEEIFVSEKTETRKCIVIMEGNPHPAALKGRMSFQSFNPSIDKLNEEAGSFPQPQTSAARSSDQIGRFSSRENGFSQAGMESSKSDSDSDEDLKRKALETESPHKSRINLGNKDDLRTLMNNSKGSYKQQKLG